MMLPSQLFWRTAVICFAVLHKLSSGTAVVNVSSQNIFNFTAVNYQSPIQAGENETIVLNVTNLASINESVVIEVYLSWLDPPVPTPKWQLVDFARMSIAHGQSVNTTFTIKPRQMAVWEDKDGWVVEHGDIVIYLGNHLPSSKSQPGEDTGAVVIVEIHGRKVIGKLVQDGGVTHE